jgi:hypothetical protein
MIRYQENCLTNNATAKVTPEEPVTEPVTLSQAKAWLKMESISDDDEIIEGLITEARQWLERYCGVCLVNSNIEAIISVKNRQQLPYGPIPDLSAIVIMDMDNTVITDNCVSVVGIDGGFPVLTGSGQYRLTYESGYEEVPAALIGAIKSYILFAYEHRGDDLDENSNNFAPKARQKAFPYRQNIGF